MSFIITPFFPHIFFCHTSDFFPIYKNSKYIYKVIYVYKLNIKNNKESNQFIFYFHFYLYFFFF